MSFLSKLFGGGGGSAPEPHSEDYEGFKITPNPQKADGGYRIGAIVEKDGKRHELIRADVIGDLETASQASLSKAQQLIDHQGMRLFDD